MSFKTRFLLHFVWKSVGFKAFAFRLKFFKLGLIYAHFSFLKFRFFCEYDLPQLGVGVCFGTLSPYLKSNSTVTALSAGCEILRIYI